VEEEEEEDAEEEEQFQEYVQAKKKFLKGIEDKNMLGWSADEVCSTSISILLNLLIYSFHFSFF
jgi:hypothetical protein